MSRFRVSRPFLPYLILEDEWNPVIKKGKCEMWARKKKKKDTNVSQVSVTVAKYLRSLTYQRKGVSWLTEFSVCSQMTRLLWACHEAEHHSREYAGYKLVTPQKPGSKGYERENKIPIASTGACLQGSDASS